MWWSIEELFIKQRKKQDFESVYRTLLILEKYQKMPNPSYMPPELQLLYPTITNNDEITTVFVIKDNEIISVLETNIRIMICFLIYSCFFMFQFVFNLKLTMCFNVLQWEEWIKSSSFDFHSRLTFPYFSVVFCPPLWI